MFSFLQTYHKDKLKFIGSVLLSLTILLTFKNNALAQNSEIGFELGAHHYLGDVVRKFQPSSTNMGAQFFVRKHLNDGVSLRMSIGGGGIAGTDNEAFDVFSANRTASFDARFVNADFLVEYHFLDYRNDKLQQYWTPYVFFGAGFYALNGESSFDGGQRNTSYSTSNVRLPVGVGIKYRFNRRWILGLSTSAIKTNSDLIDNVSDATDPLIKNFSGGNPNDDDWIFYTAVSISFTFHKIHCPEGWFK